MSYPNATIAGHDRVPRATVALTLAAGLAGAGTAALGALGPVSQVAIVLGLSVGAPLLLLFLLRPHHALAAYLVILPLLVPVTLFAGLNPGEVLTLAVLVVGGFGLWEARERAAEALSALRPILIPLAGLAVVSAISLVVNGIATPEDVISALFKVLAFGLMAALVHMHADTPRKARLLLGGAVAGATAVAVYSVIGWALGWSYSEEFGWNRAMGTFENWNLLGGFMALMSMPTLALAAVARRAAVRWLLGLAFLLQLLALLLSLTLGSLVGLAFGAAVTVLFIMPGGRRRVLPAVLLTALAAGVAFGTNPLLRDKVTRFDERLEDRLLTYMVGVNMFRDRVWWGFGSEQNLTEELLLGEADYGITSIGVSSMVPHNSFIKVAVEKGIAGFLFFTALVIGSLRVLFRWRRRLTGTANAPLFYGITAGVLAFLTQNMTNDILLHARIGIVFFALIALIDQVARTTDG